MIRYAVGFVLLLYFLGADIFAPYRPNAVDNSLRTFHTEINRGTWQIVGPVITFLRGYDGGGWVRKSDSE